MPTPAQLKKIFAAAREARVEEADLRDIVQQVSGQRSTRALDVDQAKQVIDSLVGLGARRGVPRRKPAGSKRPDGVVAMLSPRQRAYIADLRRKMGGDWLKEVYFEGACRKLIGRTAPRTSAEGARVIEMLRARHAHELARAAAPRIEA